MLDVGSQSNKEIPRENTVLGFRRLYTRLVLICVYCSTYLLTWNAGCSFNVEFSYLVLNSCTVLGVLASTSMEAYSLFSLQKQIWTNKETPELFLKASFFLKLVSLPCPKRLNSQKIHKQYPASPEVMETVFDLPPCPQVARPDSGEKHFDPQL